MQNPKTVLTQRQKDIYEFLRDKIVHRGYGPTVREIGTQFGIRSPNGVMCHLKALEKKGLITREPNMSRAIQLTNSPKSRSSLPLAGMIAAGSPSLALPQEERIDFSGLFNGDDHVCLRVKGESMIDAHIQEGDYVVMKRGVEARDGDIVVARVDGDEATLKRYYRETKRVRLEPGNKGMQPIFTSHVDIEGVVVGVIRQY